MAADDPVSSGMAAIEWCYQHGLYQQAYTIADELMITAACIKLNLNVNDLETRKMVSCALHAAIKISQKRLKEPLDDEEKFRRLVENFLEYPKLLKIVHQISDNRNDINHAGWRKNPLSAEHLEMQFNDDFNDYKTQLFNFYRSPV